VKDRAPGIPPEVFADWEASSNFWLKEGQKLARKVHGVPTPAQWARSWVIQRHLAFEERELVRLLEVHS
jgi:hypothetical protein